jgi:hypothetical protein
VRLFVDVLDRLNAENIQYVTVGGVAVVVHGHMRITADVNLVVSLDTENATRVVEVLNGLGLKPRIPVNPLDFADPETRKDWVENRNLTVFSMADPLNPFLLVDLFVNPPIPFEELFQRSVIREVDGTPVRVCSKEDLIVMKRMSGRPEDLADIQALEDLPND